MWNKLIAIVVVLTMPAGASAGPLKEAVEKAGRELAAAQQQGDETQSRARRWSGWALLAGGGVLTTLGSVEIGDDESGPDDGEDSDDSDDGEDSDGWGNKAMIGGGIAAASLGAVLLLTGRGRSGPVVSVRPGGVGVRQTVRF
ncbi:MAG TPA: hypothetical protein VIX63_15330 [Vicinamibacterales bacterium]